MSQSRRESSSTGHSNDHYQYHQSQRHANDQIQRKRSHRHVINSHQIEHEDRTVYVTNLPAEKLGDQELINFFTQFGVVTDIRVFKDHLLVQYQKVDQANRLVQQSPRSLILRSKRLEIRSSKDISVSVKKSLSRERSSTRDDEPDKKRFLSKHHLNASSYSNSKDSPMMSSTRSSIDSRNDHSNNLYSILSGPKSSEELVDCQILIVNMRQRKYAEEIESRLICEGLRTSIRLLREDFTLTSAVENARHERSLYAILAMPMHEERRTASFHILYGQTEEHRNLALSDGYQIILTNYLALKKNLQDEIEPEFSEETKIAKTPSNEHSKDEAHPFSRLTINDRFPLSMLLCLLADGRQLTLEEIDRVLVYLLEKKAKMLTLPPGTLPPLPAQYATKSNNFTLNDTQPVMKSNENVVPQPEINVDSCLTPLLGEQILQLLSNNHNLSLDVNALTTDSKKTLESLSTALKMEQKKSFQLNKNENYSNNPGTTSLTDGQSFFTNSLLLSSALSAANASQTVNSLAGPPYSTIQSTVANSIASLSQSSDYSFANGFTNLYSFPLSSNQLDSIYQTYSQMNTLPILTSSTLNPSTHNSQTNAKQEN